MIIRIIRVKILRKWYNVWLEDVSSNKSTLKNKKLNITEKNTELNRNCKNIKKKLKRVSKSVIGLDKERNCM